MHFYRTEVAYARDPVESYRIKQVPIYRTFKGKNDAGAIVGGAIVGAVVGGDWRGSCQRNPEEARLPNSDCRVRKKEGCSTDYRMASSIQEVYSHSTITFVLDGVFVTTDFTRP